MGIEANVIRLNCTLPIAKAKNKLHIHHLTYYFCFKVVAKSVFKISINLNCLCCLMLKNTENIKALQQKLSLNEDMKAYQGLYEILFKQLKNFSFSFVKSNEAAEEIVSDVFIKLWQIRSRLMEVDNLTVYLYTIAKNFSLNYITKNYKNPVVSLDKIEVEVFVNLNNPEELCISADHVKAIRQTIRQLPPQCSLIFQLVKEDGLSYKEVAEILHVSIFTVRNQVAIATRKIAETLPVYIGGAFIKTGNLANS